MTVIDAYLDGGEILKKFVFMQPVVDRHVQEFSYERKTLKCGVYFVFPFIIAVMKAGICIYICIYTNGGGS